MQYYISIFYAWNTNTSVCKETTSIMNCQFFCDQEKNKQKLLLCFSREQKVCEKQINKQIKDGEWEIVTSLELLIK